MKIFLPEIESLKLRIVIGQEDWISSIVSCLYNIKEFNHNTRMDKKKRNIGTGSTIDDSGELKRCKGPGILSLVSMYNTLFHTYFYIENGVDSIRLFCSRLLLHKQDFAKIIGKSGHTIVNIRAKSGVELNGVEVGENERMVYFFQYFIILFSIIFSFFQFSRLIR